MTSLLDFLASLDRTVRQDTEPLLCPVALRPLRKYTLAINMCLRITYTYGCGHQRIDLAPCAGQKSGACRGIQNRVIAQGDKCDSCGG